MGLEVSSVGRSGYSSSTKDTQQVCRLATEEGFPSSSTNDTQQVCQSAKEEEFPIKGEDISYDCCSSSKRCFSSVPFLKLTCICNAENPEVKKDKEQNVKRSYLFIK